MFSPPNLLLQIALHVSGSSSTHHQEHKTVHTVSGIVKPILLLSFNEMELHHPQKQQATVLV
jgi:hypothetical protein